MAKYLQTAVLCTLLGLCVFIVAAQLYRNSHPVDAGLHYEITQTLTQLREIDARWDTDVLRSRLQLNTNYDPLIESTSALEQLERQLADAIRQVAPGERELLDSLAQYEDAFSQKIDAVERFKSQNAILRNSVFFIATGFNNVMSALDTAAVQSGMATQALIMLKTQLSTLRGHFLALITNPGGSTASDIRTGIAAVNQTLARFDNDQVLPDTVNRPLIVLLNHAQTLLRQKPLVDELLNAIADTPTTAQLDQLYEVYNAQHERQRQRSERYRAGLWLLLGAVIIVVAYLGLRYRTQRQVRFLARMNQTLEQRVEQRTAELSQAYNELKQSQSRLIQAEKMSALGQMVAGVAHEINTPLAYCSSNVEVVKEQLIGLVALTGAGTKLAELLDQPCPSADALNVKLAQIVELASGIKEEDTLAVIDDLLTDSNIALKEISEMVMNLKNFSRVDRKKTDSVNLNECLDSSLMIAKNTLKHKIEVVKNYAELPTVLCAPSQLNQVFLNLMVNASQAIEDSGTITLTTTVDGDRVDVIIEDDGPGIPDNVLPHIFDPFYTTKDVGEGTGLGLSICYQIIEQHDGSIRVDSTPGKGARFIVSLPAAKAGSNNTQQFEKAAA